MDPRWFTVTVALCAALPARAALTVHLDCYLPEAQVSCSALQGAYFSSPAFTRMDEDADVGFAVRAIETADGDAYTVAVTGRDPGMHFTFTDRVARGCADDAVVLRLTGD